MENVTVNFKMEKNLKEKFEKVCGNIGLSLSSAFNIFAKAVVRDNKIPFEIKGDSEDDIKHKKAVNLIKNLNDKINNNEITEEEYIKLLKDFVNTNNI